MRGIGETFQPDLHTGTGNYSVVVELPPGRVGLTPKLALGYSSGNRNGPFGLGWQLSLPGIRRKTDKKIPRYEAEDVFVLSGAEDLVPVPKSDWIIASGLTTPGHLYLINGRDRSSTVLFPTEPPRQRPDTQTYSP